MDGEEEGLQSGGGGGRRERKNSVLMEFAILLLPLAVAVAMADRWIMNTV